MPKVKLKQIIDRLHYRNVSVTRNLTDHTDISVDQLRAARSLLNWSQADLSKKSGYALATINNIERGQYEAHAATLGDIIQTFEEAGIQFIDGPGVRIQICNFRIKYYEGPDALNYLCKKIAASLEKGGDLYICGIDEKRLKEVAPEEIVFLQNCLGEDVNVNILTNRSLSSGIVFQNLKKKVVEDDVPLTPFFVYNGRVALVLLQNPIHITIIYNEQLSEQYKAQFQYIWNKEKSL